MGTGGATPTAPGGATPTGTGAAAGATGAAPGATPMGVAGGCACRIVQARGFDVDSGVGVVALVGLFAVVTRRRRRPR